MLNALRALLSEGVSPCGECRRRQYFQYLVYKWFVCILAHDDEFMGKYGGVNLHVWNGEALRVRIYINRVPPFSTFKKF